MTPLGKASTQKKTFSRTTSVQQHIQAPAQKVWQLLTQLADYPTWNSTIISLEGQAKVGEKLKLKSTLDAKRTFKLKVKEVVPQERMVWGDAMGARTYSLTREGDLTLFSMTETIGGPLFPLFASKIPPFDASFEAFAHDLKQTAESSSK
ncbi:MAG: SRPBCC domain-containing protein [Bacteroidota bacterium]